MLGFAIFQKKLPFKQTTAAVCQTKQIFGVCGLEESPLFWGFFSSKGKYASKSDIRSQSYQSQRG